MLGAVTISTQSQAFEWGPYILLGVSALIGIGSYVAKKLIDTLRVHSDALTKQSTSLALLVASDSTQTAGIEKYHDEIIDLKIATAELNEQNKGFSSRLRAVEERLDRTQPTGFLVGPPK